jgi:hypothetical protein
MPKIRGFYNLSEALGKIIKKENHNHFIIKMIVVFLSTRDGT